MDLHTAVSVQSTIYGLLYFFYYVWRGSIYFIIFKKYCNNNKLLLAQHTGPLTNKSILNTPNHFLL